MKTWVTVTSGPTEVNTNLVVHPVVIMVSVCQGKGRGTCVCMLEKLKFDRSTIQYKDTVNLVGRSVQETKS